MKVNLHTPIEEVQIQIIPLIDVVFCILTFFLLAALQFTRQQAINVDLPKASTGSTSAASSQSKSDILPVTIDAVGQTYIEKDPVSKDELESRLRQYVEANPNGILVLNASRTATYNDVIQTLDLLRQVGGNRVSLGIIPGPSESLTNSPIPSFVPSIPNTVPIPGTDTQGNSTPSLPSAPPFPSNGEGINPGISPTVPNNSVPQMPEAPGVSNSTPKR
ncbi:biopolymer transporter ExbD [Anabaena cylindrica FACHB-243]|uniref:Biopolymer transport protein ExbD/TolR n=1 Tax=Anabaena cylindrica (strain ATCC 27899 / PCC 7122) TaxID=272123 RepID=K9ZLD5_ANACC|nr:MULTISPECIES: biopolymer transporter ExbD [Anabaena]AFZ59135.1 Biopolymer transport protein ExbD/TolR [Anabaena cylindrica PCC 7122]MBD2416486.1 biopolymer transporter ExbD [Anabaena cylindrica FACHB-243]MBY5281058.1 biopolymer transporter ExbD [Anabaena sp. CCAP 1446/1C]MBY5309845.1 biopolymer transporter ExbD [Anabaena sp. CCAP 1446/1C]MCM2407423.1 biopolymer transporter ExbD [Anabaena sp. CCAP 1446/1C]